MTGDQFADREQSDADRLRDAADTLEKAGKGSGALRAIANLHEVMATKLTPAQAAGTGLPVQKSCACQIVKDSV